MTHPDSPSAGGSGRDGVSLRLVWPQWQGGGTSSVRELASEFPFDVARRGYAVGSAVLEAVLPPHDGPTVTVPVTMSGDGLAERDSVEAKTVILDQLARAVHGHKVTETYRSPRKAGRVREALGAQATAVGQQPARVWCRIAGGS